MKITKAQAAVAYSVGDKETVTISNVQIRDGKMLACDGYMLVETDIPEQATFRVPGKTLLSIAKKTKKEMSISPESDTSVVIESEEGKFVVPTYNSPEFPKTDHLWQTNPHSYIALDPKYIKRLANMLAMSKTNCIRFYIWDPKHGVQFSYNDDNLNQIRGIVMPMFVDWNNDPVLEKGYGSYVKEAIYSIGNQVESIPYGEKTLYIKRQNELHINQQSIEQSYKWQDWQEDCQWLEIEEVKKEV